MNNNLLRKILQMSKYTFYGISLHLLLVGMLTASPSDAQSVLQGNTITGKIISSEDNEGLPGVNVIVKGTSQGTVTDLEGNYSVEVPDENPYWFLVRLVLFWKKSL